MFRIKRKYGMVRDGEIGKKYKMFFEHGISQYLFFLMKVSKVGKFSSLVKQITY